jgi:hypothetical protein
MKTFLLSILSGAVALGTVMGAAQNPDEVQQPKNKNRVHTPPSRPVTAPPRTVPQTPKVQRNANVPPQFQNQNRVKPTNPNQRYVPRVPTTDAEARNYVRNNPTFQPDRDAPRSRTIPKSDVTAPNQNWRTQRPTPPVTSNTTAQTNPNVRNRDWQNRTNHNRNWQNNNTSGTFTYEQARHRHNRTHHHRVGWRSHYSRIALFAGGYYYWDNNYWYPAYGYDPYYSTYAYDEPIYGSNDLDPGQVIANVQTALQEQGYYRSAVDGLIGPATRAALANFQQNQGLPITSAIDGPTLQALGLN